MLKVWKCTYWPGSDKAPAMSTEEREINFPSKTVTIRAKDYAEACRIAAARYNSDGVLLEEIIPEADKPKVIVDPYAGELTTPLDLEMFRQPYNNGYGATNTVVRLCLHIAFLHGWDLSLYEIEAKNALRQLELNRISEAQKDAIERQRLSDERKRNNFKRKHGMFPEEYKLAEERKTYETLHAKFGKEDKND